MAARVMRVSRISFAASKTALPDTMTWRLAAEGPASGDLAVSALITRTADIPTPSLSAVNCATTVTIPWPISAAPLLTSTEPSRCISTRMPAWSARPRPTPAPFKIVAIPQPRRKCAAGWRSARWRFSQSANSAALRKDAFRAVASRTTTPVYICVPVSIALSRRISNGSISSLRAISSIWHS